MAQRLGVVVAEVLDVVRLEPGALERELDARQVERRAVGEHVALRERAVLGLAHAQASDPVVQHAPARLHEPRELARVHVDLVRADVLDHADARHGVERPVTDLAVVLHADLHPVREAALGHALARELGLRLGQRDADHA